MTGVAVHIVPLLHYSIVAATLTCSADNMAGSVAKGRTSESRCYTTTWPSSDL